jgi:hypothetical protein
MFNKQSPVTIYYLPITNNQLCKTNPICYSNKKNTTFLLAKDYEQITMNNEPMKTNPNKPNQTQTNSKRVGWGLYPTNSSCISRPIVLYFFLYNAVYEGPMRISRPAGQSVPSVAGCKLAFGGLEDKGCLE